MSLLGASVQKTVQLSSSDGSFEVRVTRRNGELVCADNRERDQILSAAIAEAFGGADASSFLECRWYDAPQYFEERLTSSSDALKMVVGQKRADNGGKEIGNFSKIRDEMSEGTCTAALYAVASYDAALDVNEDALKAAIGTGDVAECTIVRLVKGVSSDCVAASPGSLGLVGNRTFPTVGYWEPYLSQIMTFGRDLMGERCKTSHYRDVAKKAHALDSSQVSKSAKDEESLSEAGRDALAGPWRVGVDENGALGHFLFLSKESYEKQVEEEPYAGILLVPNIIIGTFDRSYGSYYAARIDTVHNGKNVLVCIAR